MRRCPHCGEENPAQFRLCGFCGSPLAPAAAAPEVRKTVTVVFCDLKGSTSLGERLDSEALREVLGRYFEIMRTILERHGGTVEKYIGDAIMAVFGLPRLHEDDALRAVRAATEMRSALGELNDELERRWGVRLANRTGVNTGEVVAGDVTLGQRLVTGDTVNVAARLEQAAPERDVLIGQSTYRLVREAVEVEQVEPLTLKGKSEPVPAYRLISVRAGEWFRRRLEAPLVGRTNELDLLLASYRRATQEHRLEAVTIVGQAGMGKTRLLAEMLRRIGADAQVLRGHCLSYGDGMTFWPLAEIVRQAAGATATDSSETARIKLARLLGDGDVVERLATVTGLASGSFPIQETYWAARRFIEILASRGSLVVIFEDIHWAEPTLLGLIEHVVDSAREAGAFVVCGARHDLFDEHPRWLEGRTNVARVVLQPLTGAESALIIENLFERASLPPLMRERLIANADGNPLFVEQMLSMLVDDGVLRRHEDGHWVAAVDAPAVDIPPTISALISARLDRLAHEERGVLETGSVAGVVFFEDAVREIGPELITDQVSVNLILLAQKQLVRDEPSTVPNVRAFRFAHVLVREATYKRLLKRTRAELHERFAAWLERVTAARALEYEELVGYHLERSCQYLDELGPRDQRAMVLAVRASEHLASAGARASARGDMPAAANLIQRAMAIRPHSDPVGIELAVDLADALREMGEFDRARDVVTNALVAAPIEDQRLLTSLGLVQLLVDRSTGPAGWAEKAQRDSERAVAIFANAGDHVGMARAFRLLATIHGTACRYRAAQDAVEQAVEEARLAGDTRQETRSLPALALCALFGPQPVSDAIELCERLVEQTSGDRRAQSGVRYVLAQLCAMRGDFDAAREHYRGARRTLEDLGDRRQAAFSALFAGRVELLAGDPLAAEAVLGPPYETLRRAGERNFVPTAAALLAEAAYAQGRYGEADALSRVSEEIASSSDVESQYRWRCVQAKVLAHAGEVDAALELVNAALGLVLTTDGPVLQADVYADLSVVHAMGGDAVASARAREKAERLYAMKGDVVSSRSRVSDLRLGGVRD